MQEDFHYYGTYCAAAIAGYSAEESSDIAYSAQLVDLCSRTFLDRIKGPRAAATTQLQLELADAVTDILGLQDITRIWASFHFLPRNLYADKKSWFKSYRNKFRLICGPNSELLIDTVELARGKGPQAIGLAMHVLADTWAHMYFAGTPSLVINNMTYPIFEMVRQGDGFIERPIVFNHNARGKDDLEKGRYINTIYQGREHSIMNLGHGRAGHLPDYSFMRYRYLPVWGDYEEILKDNPSDYYRAFSQMVYALKCLRPDGEGFKINTYADHDLSPWNEDIRGILEKRQFNASLDWKALGKRIAGEELRDFKLDRYEAEYVASDMDKKDNSFLGRFILAALAQKSMVTNRIYRSGNLLAGYSINVRELSLKRIGQIISAIRK